MAEGIRRRHSKGCLAKHGKRCTCNAGWGASLYLEPGGRRITKTFSREAGAKSWRADAMRARDRESCGRPPGMGARSPRRRQPEGGATSPWASRKIQTIFDVYGHLLPGSHDEVRQRMDAYLGAGNKV